MKLSKLSSNSTGLMASLLITLTVFATPAFADDNETETISDSQDQASLDKLFSNPAVAVGKSVEHLPASIEKDFGQHLKEFGESRSPASISKNPVVIHQAPAKSRMPASVSDGFEMLVHFGKIVSAFWVVKRGDKLDFVFANNSGSRVAVGLSPESFSFLQTQAENAAENTVTAPNCGDRKIELHVVSDGKPQRSIASCIDAKTKPAKSLRELSELLASFAR